MVETAKTVREKVQALEPVLTRAERQLVNQIMKNYPMSGLGSITRIAAEARVSTPTVARLAQKLGFSGFPAFQTALREELEERFSNPILKHDRWAAQAPEAHILNRFTEAVIDNLRQTLAQIDADDFDRAANLIADPGHHVFIVGGRITHALADYLYLHLQVIRPGVTLVPPNSSAWPHSALDMRAGDVMIVYDIRRYENATLQMARFAAEQGVRIILITDQWQSPVSAEALVTFNCRIEVPSAWDSTVAALHLSETLIAAAQDAGWDGARERMARLEGLFDTTSVFRKFV